MDRKTTSIVITIGVPVYNGEKYIERALISIIQQTYSNFEVIISDNASTDSTGEICEKIIGNDDRFCYVRRKSKISAENNFKFIIEKATTDLFVFLAADDYWDPEFLELTIARLVEEKDAVACISKVNFIKDGVFLFNAYGDFEIRGSITVRLRKYFHDATDNSRFYAVYRREAMQDSFQDLPRIHSLDWYIVALTLIRGDHLRVDKTLMYREAPDLDKYVRSLKYDNKGYVFGEFFPILPLTMALFRRLSLMEYFKIALSLLRLNLIMHIHYTKIEFPNSIYCKTITIMGRFMANCCGVKKIR